MLKMKYFGVLAGCALATGSLCAANYSEAFEGASASAWEGGELYSTNYTYTGITGLPLSGDHTQVLLIEGDVTCTPDGGTFAGTPMVDMMVQAALPDEELETPEAGAHIAIAVDTNGIFNVYCKNRSDVAGWYPLSNTAYADGTWARVSLLFDYAKGRCQVRLDGQPMMTSNGYLNETTTETTYDGAWYKLVATGTDSSTAVSNLKVIGCTAVDDVVITEDNTTAYAMTANATNSAGVSCAWLDANGLSWDTTQSYDSSKKADGTTAMTVADKYKYCFDPFDGQGEADFAVKSITTTAEKVTLALPTTVETAGRKLVVDYGTDKDFGTGTYTTTDEVTGDATVQIDIPAPGSVTYYRLRATDK